MVKILIAVCVGGAISLGTLLLVVIYRWSVSF